MTNTEDKSIDKHPDGKSALLPAKNFVKLIYIHILRSAFMKIREKWMSYIARLVENDEGNSMNAPHLEQDEIIVEPPEEQQIKSSHPFSFLEHFRTAVTATMGLSHLWRFPYNAYYFGGGTFLILYLVMTLFSGYILHFTELANGQYSSKPVSMVFQKVPLMEGLGYSMIIYSYFLVLYHTQTVSYGLYYLVSSFDYQLPWAKCNELLIDNGYSVCRSVDNPDLLKMDCPLGQIVFNSTRFCNNNLYYDYQMENCCGSLNRKQCIKFNPRLICERKKDLPSMYFWNNRVARLSLSNEKLSNILKDYDLKQILCTFLTWFLIYILISMGKKWAGIIGLLATIALIIAFCLLIPFGLSLSGSLDGIHKLYIPDVKHFRNSSVWFKALEHSFYSLGIGTGLVHSLGSVAAFDSPCQVNTFMIIFWVIVSSLLSTSVVYIAIGIMAQVTGEAFEVIGKANIGTAFVAYSEMLSRLPVSWACSIAFYVCLVLVGAVSMAGIFRFVILSIYRTDINKVRKRYVCNFFIVMLTFIFGIPLVSKAGIHIIEQIDWFPVGMALFVLILLEIVSLFIYGLNLFFNDASFMLGFHVNAFFATLLIFSPVPIIAVSTYVWLDFKKYMCKGLFGIIPCASYLIILAPLIFVMMKNVLIHAGRGRVRGVIEMPPDYGPAVEEHRIKRRNYRKLKLFI